MDRGENVLAFGLPGRGKTHFLAALGRELNRLQGYQGSALSERVQLLYARGQVSRDEFKALLLQLAGMGVLEARAGGADGR